MGIDNSLFGKIQSPIITPALAAHVDKANENKAREDSMKEIMSRKPNASTDQAQLAATVAPQKKPTTKSEPHKPTQSSSPAKSKSQSWQDKMGSDAVEMGKTFYEVDAKNYSSKADYDKAIDEAIAKRDAGLKGETTPQPKAETASKDRLIVAEGPNAGQIADMAKSESATVQPSSQTNSPSTAASQPTATNPYAGFTPPPGVYVKEMRTNPNTGVTYPVWSEPGEAAPAAQSSQPFPTQQPQTEIAPQMVANAPATPQPSATGLPSGVLQQGVNAQGQPYIVVTPEYAQAQGLTGQQSPQAGYPAQAQGPDTRYVTAPAQPESSGGFLSNLSPTVKYLLAGGLGAFLGYQMGKNSNDDSYDNDGYGRGYGYYDS